MPTTQGAAGPDPVTIHHEFKSHPSVFWPAARGEKAFEYRRDDRGGYEIGQTVRLRCFVDGAYTDDAPLDRRITNILRGGEFELPLGYCVLSLAPLSATPSPAPAADVLEEGLERLRALSEAATKGRWFTESEKCDGSYGSGEDGHEGYLAYSIVTDAESPHGKPGVIAETTNSTLSIIHEEWSEDDFTAWDDIAKNNTAFICAAVNYVRDYLAYTQSAAEQRAGGERERVGAAIRLLSEIADSYSDREDDNFAILSDMDVLMSKLRLRHFRAIRSAQTVLLAALTPTEPTSPVAAGWRMTEEEAREEARKLIDGIIYDRMAVANHYREKLIGAFAKALAAAPVVPEGGANIGDERAICEALGFDPTNHHNALGCPYCNPKGLILAAPAGPEGGDGWQPIETAPKDGREIIVFGGRYEAPAVTQADGDWWRSSTARGLCGLPTHWRPLPPPPAHLPAQGEA